MSSIMRTLGSVGAKSLQAIKNNPKTAAAVASFIGIPALDAYMGRDKNQAVQESSANMPQTGMQQNLPQQYQQNMTYIPNTPPPVAPVVPTTPSNIPTGSTMPDTGFNMGNTPSVPGGVPPVSTGGNFDLPGLFQKRAELQAKRMSDRANGTGLYAGPAGVPLSPDQLRQIYKDADNFYEQQLGNTDAQISLLESQIKNPISMYGSMFGGNSNSGQTSSTGRKAQNYLQKLMASGVKIGNTQADTQRILTLVAQMPADEQLKQITTIYKNTLPVEAQKTWDNNIASAEKINYITNNFSDVKTNPYKYATQNLVTYFGSDRDPRYIALKALTEELSGQIRNDRFGAALTNTEAELAGTYLPRFESDTAPEVLQKLEMLRDAAEFANEVKLSSALNLERPNFKDFIFKRKALREGKTEAEIDAYLEQGKSGSQSFNSVGNTTASLTKDQGYTLDDYKRGIEAVESKGSGGYVALGPVMKTGMYKGDRAYGKYQVMGKNIPEWTKEAFGFSMTPQQFLANPQAQEELFAYRSEQAYKKYGNWADVASVWFSGQPLANNTRSDGQTTVPQYVAKMAKAMNERPLAQNNNTQYVN